MEASGQAEGDRCRCQGQLLPKCGTGIPRVVTEMRNADERVLKLLKASNGGLRFSEIRKVLGQIITDKTLAASLRRLATYHDIRRVLYYDGRRPRVIYVAVEEGDNAVEVWLKREVVLEDGTRCY